MRVPVIVLAGSDRRASSLPDAGRAAHPLAGYKGAELRVGQRPLVAELALRLEACGAFDPPVRIAGPASVYEGLVPGIEVIDTDGTFGDNIQASVDTLRREAPGRPIAFLTCDVLPEVELLDEAMAAWRERERCALWFPLVRAPAERRRLGASAWKPRYRIVPREGEPAVEVLPGHLAVVRPEALRADFACRLFQVGYRTRNRPIHERRGAMVRALLAQLLLEDLGRLARLRVPRVTWSIAGAGLPAAARLQAGRLTVAGLERALSRMLVRHAHRRAHPRDGAVVPLSDWLPLALDVDTEEEAAALGARWAVAADHA